MRAKSAFSVAASNYRLHRSGRKHKVPMLMKLYPPGEPGR
jgi:hypothetical protein